MDGLLIFFLVVCFGLLLEVVTFLCLEHILGKPFRHQNKYAFGKHASLMSIPIWGFISLLVTKHYSYAELFLLGAAVGTFAEYLFGRFFYRIEGRRIWTYNFGTFAGFTSIFSIPYWGGATLLFVLLAKSLGV